MINYDEVRRLYLTGLATRQVANKLGLSKSAVYKICRDITRTHSEAAQLAYPPTGQSQRSLRSQARKIYERFHKVKLEWYEVVHHKDENPTNNNIANLQLMDIGDHARLHQLKHVDSKGNKIKRLDIPGRREYMKEYLKKYNERKREIIRGDWEMP